MTQKHSVCSVLILLLFCASGCATSVKKWIEADMLFDRTHSSAKNWLNQCDKDDYVENGDFVFVNGKSAAHLKKLLGKIPDEADFSMRYCPTGFALAPQLLRGAYRNVFLADRRIVAALDVEVDVERLHGVECVVVKGISAQERGKH